MEVMIDCLDGVASSNSISEAVLTPNEQAVLFWLSSGTPLFRLSVLSGQTIEVLTRHVDEISRKLQISSAELPQVNLAFQNGKAPRPSTSWENRTMPSLVSEALLSRNPEDVFILDARGDTITVGETLAVVSRIRSSLREVGVQAGDTIAADTDLRLETYFITLAAWLHGTQLIRLNSNGSSAIALSQLERTPAKIVFTSRVRELQAEAQQSRFIALADENDESGACEFSSWVAKAPEPSEDEMMPAHVQPTDICVISSTSGTTGMPKSVLLSQHAVWWGCDRAYRIAQFEETDVFCTATDFVGDMSTYAITGIPLLARARVLIPRPISRRSPLDFVQDCLDAGVNCPMIVPSALRTVLSAGDHVAAEFWRSLKYLISASAPFGAPLAREFRTRSDAEIIEYLGSREYGGSLVARTTGTKILSAGGGFGHEVLLRIVDDSGRFCPTNKIGNLLVVSLGLMDGYVLPEGRTRCALTENKPRLSGHDLWYNTNDLAIYTDAGDIQIMGRRSDLMKAPDGQIVMPLEVESVLQEDGRVQEACVFSVISQEGLEIIVAAILLKETPNLNGLENQLKQLVHDRLGNQKTPRNLLFFDAFPRVAQNKPDKSKLKALCAEAIERRTTGNTIQFSLGNSVVSTGEKS